MYRGGGEAWVSGGGEARVIRLARATARRPAVLTLPPLPDQFPTAPGTAASAPVSFARSGITTIQTIPPWHGEHAPASHPARCRGHLAGAGRPEILLRDATPDSTATIRTTYAMPYPMPCTTAEPRYQDQR
jgi:hypothetical protein